MVTSAGSGPLWCEGFDADLLAVVPGALDELGDTADVKLWTYSTPTNGKINCPASWWTDAGLASFFSTTDRSPIPASFRTSDPLVDCTFLEAIRDEWVHQSLILVNGVLVWRPPARAMEQLMYDVRGWHRVKLTDDERDEIRDEVLTSLADAVFRLRSVTDPAPSDANDDSPSLPLGAATDTTTARTHAPNHDRGTPSP